MIRLTSMRGGFCLPFAAETSRRLVERAEAASLVEDESVGVRPAERAGMHVLSVAGGRHWPSGHGTKSMEAGADPVFAPKSGLRSLMPGAFDPFVETS